MFPGYIYHFLVYITGYSMCPGYIYRFLVYITGYSMCPGYILPFSSVYNRVIAVAVMATKIFHSAKN